ncbi:hypothetical protein, partial [Photobacterium angustum]|uniref:hypothetical protein n=1 Tax=Photobacterium angustum TaxID=661 RepID=UPI0005DC162F
APPLQGGGHWFEPGIAHHSLKVFCTDFADLMKNTFVKSAFLSLKIVRKWLSLDNCMLFNNLES